MYLTQVKAHLLESIANDTELQKAEILFLGSYGRACEFLSGGDAEVRAMGPVRPSAGRPAGTPCMVWTRLDPGCGMLGLKCPARRHLLSCCSQTHGIHCPAVVLSDSTLSNCGAM